MYKRQDPDLSKIPASKVSATSSNPSVLKVIDKYNIDFANYHPNMDIGIEIEAMKAGKATLTIQYKTCLLYTSVRFSYSNFRRSFLTETYHLNSHQIP